MVTLGRVLCVAVVAVAAWFAARALGVDAAGSSWIWLAATVLVGGTATVIRSPLERSADKVAYGAGGDPYRVLSGFVERISETLAVDDVLPHVARTVTQALHSPRGEVRLWLADGEQWKQTWPRNSADAESLHGELGMMEVPLQHHGEQVGELGVAVTEELTADDRALLGRLAGTAGLALSNVRLAYDLRRQVAESRELADNLALSRQRLLDAAAQQTERFATMVDHHVQSRLDAVGVSVWIGSRRRCRRAAVAHAEATAALAALRELAAGVFPPALADRGLRDALDMYCGRFDGRVRLRTTGERVAARWPSSPRRTSASSSWSMTAWRPARWTSPLLTRLTRFRLHVSVSGPPAPRHRAIVERSGGSHRRQAPSLAAERQWSVDITWAMPRPTAFRSQDRAPIPLEIRAR